MKALAESILAAPPGSAGAPATATTE